MSLAVQLVELASTPSTHWSVQSLGTRLDRRSLTSSLRLLDTPRYSVDFLRGLASDVTGYQKMVFLYEGNFALVPLPRKIL